MQKFPHMYSVKVAGKPENNLTVYAENLPPLEIAPPLQFDGPGDQWSPEDLLMASVANCFVLSFRAIARANKLEWSSIECVSEGTLDRVNGKALFAHILTKVKLNISQDQSVETAEKTLNRAEETCLISNSLTCISELEFNIVGGDA